MVRKPLPLRTLPLLHLQRNFSTSNIKKDELSKSDNSPGSQKKNFSSMISTIQSTNIPFRIPLVSPRSQEDLSSQSIINKHVYTHLEQGKITVFANGICSNTLKVQQMLDDVEAVYEIVDISKCSDRNYVIYGLHTDTGFLSYPNIYMGLDNHIGGYDDLYPVFNNEEKLRQELDKAQVPYNSHKLSEIRKGMW